MAEADAIKNDVQPEGPDMPDDEVLYELADLFRVFGDSTRIKILYALHDNELCVQDIADAVQLSQSAVSHQLRVLKDSKLVRFRREGKTVFYLLSQRFRFPLSHQLQIQMPETVLLLSFYLPDILFCL